MIVIAGITPLHYLILIHQSDILGALHGRVILEPGSFIMERKMLLGINERAEGAARPQGRDGVAPGGMS
jgi:hypothetical protein